MKNLERAIILITLHLAFSELYLIEMGYKNRSGALNWFKLAILSEIPTRQMHFVGLQL